MEIIPAIDLKDGQAVRLTKGVMESAKIYSNDPTELAQRFEDMGAKWLHIVDLNGAFAGEPKNLEVVEKIRKSCSLMLELGGGIRDDACIQRYVDIGIDRVILGSIAAKEPETVKKMSKKFRVVVGIDAKEGWVATQGWAEDGGIPATDLARDFSRSHVEAIICTDIGRDGMLSGINIAFTEAIAKESGLPTIASGGLAGMEDIRAMMRSDFIGGVIVGKAFYEGRLDLGEAFKLAQTKL